MARTAWFLNFRTACLLFLTAASMYQQFSKRYEKYCFRLRPIFMWRFVRSWGSNGKPNVTYIYARSYRSEVKKCAAVTDLTKAMLMPLKAHSVALIYMIVDRRCGRQIRRPLRILLRTTSLSAGCRRPIRESGASGQRDLLMGRGRHSHSEDLRGRSPSHIQRGPIIFLLASSIDWIRR